MIYTVVCTDINDYVNWQCELLEYSWSRINQPGELIRLVACDDAAELPEHRHASVYRTRPSNVHPISGDVYVCYNRLFSLQQWLEREDVQGTILIVDSDVVFRSPIKTIAASGEPIAQPWVDYGVSSEFRLAIENASADVNVDALQQVTWPALIDAQDLRSLLPRWIEATVSIREQIKRQESDMFGFLAAAQELRLEFKPETTTAFMPWPDHTVADAPIIHYCQEVKDGRGKKLWSKFDYQPWQRVNCASSAALPYCVDLLEIVDEYSRIKSFEPTHRSDTIFIAIASYCEPELVDTINSCLNKARFPENLRFGICHQYDNTDQLTNENCLDQFSQDARIRYVTYDYQESQGGCWARNIAQQLYDGETYTLQIDAHTHMIESWDTLLIEMIQSLPSSKPLITQFPPLYSIEEDGYNYFCLEDLSQVNTGVAREWAGEGWLVHTQVPIAEHNIFPRRTRLLSGAFVFTTGEWNQVVMQDPKHFYTGEEFALAVRSYTHGYDLFDPNQIVAWHRLHPQANRKFWSDNSQSETNTKHSQGVDQLNTLLNGDSGGELGRFGLGSERTLEDYAVFSGIDCINKTVTEEAQLGIPPEIGTEKITNDDLPMAEPNLVQNEELIDVTLYLEKRDPLLLTCYESTPVLMNLFQGLRQKTTSPNDVIYLNLGEHGSEQIYFKQRQMLSIETNPPLSDAFFEQYIAQSAALENSIKLDSNNSLQAGDIAASSVKFTDEWKIWIWKNVERGSSKDDIFKQLIQHGFPWHAVRAELDHEPTLSLDQIITTPEEAKAERAYVANPAAKRIDTEKLEIYSVENFLNGDECQQLIDLIASNLQRSTVIDVTGADKSDHRTSSSCFFDLGDSRNTLAAEVSRRISSFIGINPTYSEPIQAQFYRPGEEYKPHVDWVAPDDAGYQLSLGEGGQRTWSVLVYLNSVQEGGQTLFPNAELSVRPELGKLVYWNNSTPDGELNRDTLHQSCPVVEGEKVVLTLWYRSKGIGPMYQRPSHELIPRYTIDGIRKCSIPSKLFSALSQFYSSATDADERNEFVEGGFLQNSESAVPSTMLDLPEDFKLLIRSELQTVCEEWSGQALELTSIYGIREYTRGTSLKMHTDVTQTHIISVILNVAQKADEGWPLMVDDHMFRRHAIDLQPGEMLLYEGARLAHGRPQAFTGDSYANVFVHFCPIDFSK